MKGGVALALPVCLLAAAAACLLAMAADAPWAWAWAQQHLARWLMPDWELEGPLPVQRGAQWRLELAGWQREPSAVEGWVVEPVGALRAHTSSQQGVPEAVAILLGAALVCRLRPQGAWAAAGIGLAAALLTVIVVPAWLLVGVLHSARVEALAETTAAAAHVALGLSLAHGGGWLWVVAALAACERIAARVSLAKQAHPARSDGAPRPAP